jgi:hypothetical protein
MKDSWSTHYLSENSPILQRIGAKPGTYNLKWDTSEKVIHINSYGQEWKIPLASAIDAMSLLGGKTATNDERKWDRDYCGFFNQNGIDRVPSGLMGLYYIHSSDSETMYLGKSDSCVKGRLKSHLSYSSNRRLRSAVQSGKELFFYCWESPNPSYEEAIEIKRLKGVGFLSGQRREKKPLIEYLD